MSETIPPNIKCAICGRVFTPKFYDSDGNLEYADITSHGDGFNPDAPPHKCPTKSREINLPPEES